jgi:hypothetical protein
MLCQEDEENAAGFKVALTGAATLTIVSNPGKSPAG